MKLQEWVTPTHLLGQFLCCLLFLSSDLFQLLMTKPRFMLLVSSLSVTFLIHIMTKSCLLCLQHPMFKSPHHHQCHFPDPEITASRTSFLSEWPVLLVPVNRRTSSRFNALFFGFFKFLIFSLELNLFLLHWTFKIM